MNIKRNSLVTGVAAAFLLGAGAVQADDLGLEIGGHFAEYDDFDSGFGLHGRWDVMPEVRLSGSYTAVDNLDVLTFRGGYLLELGPAELEVGGGYQFWDFDGDLEDDVYGVHGKVSYPVMDELSIRGKLEYLNFATNLDEDTLVIGLGAGYDITPEINVGLDIEIYEDDFMDQTFIRLGGSYRF